jgi:tetratricopeptide (TPR) repeat protein
VTSLDASSVSVRARLDSFAGRAIEAIVLLMVCGAPWLFGAVEPIFLFCLYTCLAILLALWGFRMVLQGQLTWRKCPVSLCLAGMIVWGLFQSLPLSSKTLSSISPATQKVYQEYLPQTNEVLTGDVQRESVDPPPGTTLSLYPDATRKDVLRLMGGFMLFAVVQNNLASIAALTRLCWVAFGNGVVLALFALMQAFSSAPDMLYWRWHSPGTVFGPFIYRNNFACYINICFGLGLGLLLSLRMARRGTSSDYWQALAGQRGFSHGQSRSERQNSVADLIKSPAQLGVLGGLALIASSSLLSLSRGGACALAVASVICIAIGWGASRSKSQVATLGVVCLAILGLLAWFGPERLEKRLTTLPTESHSRFGVWDDLFPAARDFAISGTGYGTFPYVEQKYRVRTNEDPGILYEHAHNDYLEAFIEGGSLGGLLALAATALVGFLGYRAITNCPRRTVTPLLLGCLFAFLVVAIHSVVDFGLHIPAIAILFAVVCAQLCAAPTSLAAVPAGGKHHSRSKPREEATPRPREEVYVLRGFGVAPALAAVSALSIGAMFFIEGWKDTQVQSWRAKAYRFAALETPAGNERSRRCLEQAARLDTGIAQLQIELGQAALREHEDRIENKQQVANSVLRVTTFFSDPTLTAVSGANQLLLAMGSSNATAVDLALNVVMDEKKEEQLAQEDRTLIARALVHYLKARDLCPLAAVTHMQIASHISSLEKSDPVEKYVKRAENLAATESEVWYFCGTLHLVDEDLDAAAEDWRRCLALSDYRLPDIVRRANRMKVPTAEIIRNVLPAKPLLLFKAGLALYPLPEEVEERRPFDDAALKLLQGDRRFLPEEIFAKGCVCRDLGMTDEAVANYKAALAQKPLDAEWRMELADLLYKEGRFREAQEELGHVLAVNRYNGKANQLLNAVAEAIHRNGAPGPGSLR